MTNSREGNRSPEGAERRIDTDVDQIRGLLEAIRENARAQPDGFPIEVFDTDTAALGRIVDRLLTAQDGERPARGPVHICGMKGYAEPGEECDGCKLYVEYVAACDRKGMKPR